MVKYKKKGEINMSAIPKTEEYTGLEYFNGKRVATSYPEILSKYFAENDIKAEAFFISVRLFVVRKSDDVPVCIQFVVRMCKYTRTYNGYVRKFKLAGSKCTEAYAC